MGTAYRGLFQLLATFASPCRVAAVQLHNNGTCRSLDHQVPEGTSLLQAASFVSKTKFVPNLKKQLDSLDDVIPGCTGQAECIGKDEKTCERMQKQKGKCKWHTPGTPIDNIGSVDDTRSIVVQKSEMKPNTDKVAFADDTPVDPGRKPLDGLAWSFKSALDASIKPLITHVQAIGKTLVMGSKDKGLEEILQPLSKEVSSVKTAVSETPNDSDKLATATKALVQGVADLREDDDFHSAIQAKATQAHADMYEGIMRGLIKHKSDPKSDPTNGAATMAKKVHKYLERIYKDIHGVAD